MDIIKGSINTPWETWTPTITWAAATPEAVSTIAKYKKIGKTVLFNIYITSPDGKNSGSSGYHTITLPIIPKNNDIYPICRFMDLISGGYSARPAYVRDDNTNNDLYVSSRTLTDGVAFSLYISGHYEIN